MKVRDRGKLGINWLTIEPAIVHVQTGFLGVLLIAEFGIGVARQVFGHVLANIQLFNLAILLLHLNKQLLVCVVKVALQLVVGKLVSCQCILCRIERAQIEIPQQHCLTERGHIVSLGTLFAVSACANFKVERTIYFVFFRAKY